VLLLTGDIAVYAYRRSGGTAANVTIVTGRLVTDPDTGQEHIDDELIRLTPADARELAGTLTAAADEIEGQR